MTSKDNYILKNITNLLKIQLIILINKLKGAKKLRILIFYHSYIYLNKQLENAFEIATLTENTNYFNRNQTIFRFLLMFRESMFPI